MTEFLGTLPTAQRILLIALVAVACHFSVRMLRRVSERVAESARSPGDEARANLARRQPKVATVTTLVVSTLTFAIYFVAVGFVLSELNVALTAYLATATVIGLAVGFGSQGLVQDVVIGLTLLFSDAFDIGDMVEVSGQIGRVERFGLRFTVLKNFHGQTVYIPNRNIGLVGRYRRGCIRAYVDAQVTETVDEPTVTKTVEEVARGMRAQHRAILISDPEILGGFTAMGNWRFVRLKLRVWPGQATLVESVLRQRLLAALRGTDPAYPDWFVTVTFRAVEPQREPAARRVPTGR